MRSAYFQCIGGASGDMILGSVIDAGVSLDELNDVLSKLNVNGFQVVQQRAQRGGLNGTHVVVELDDSGKRTRRWQDFVEIVEKSSLSENVVNRSATIFRRLAEAEAMVHGTTPEQTHLHELGTLDTLVDVVGSVAGLELLGIERLYCSAFPSGSGVIRSEHGLLPVPSPATAALFGMARVPVVPPPGNASETGEMVTPTGAAILTTLASFKQPTINVEKIGYGLGTRDSVQYPNALALWLGEEVGATYSTNLSLLETNIDDMTGELLGYVQERLFDIGARDVWFTPIQMKKNRPAIMLSAIVPTDLESQAVALVLKETSTLGIRVRPLHRYEAERENKEVATSLGKVSVKVKRIEGKVVAATPEYEDAREVALKQGMALQSVYKVLQQEAEEQLLDS